MQSGSNHSAATTVAVARALIIEDEPHARRYLRDLLENEPHVDLVGESANGIDGVEQIRELSPDVVFLDIQMPGLDGFKMIDQIGETRLPLFVFVTGYSEYALKAFEIEAVDYLCKPFDKDRLLISVERTIRRLNSVVPGV